MRRALIATIIALSLTAAACSPYDTPADATPDQAITTSAVRSTPQMLYFADASAPPAACDRACWAAVVERQEAERIWWAEVVAQQRRRAEAARIARIYAFAHAVEQARLARLTGGAYVQGIEVCNGRTLPTCAIVRRESRFDPNARNPASSAWGLYQFLRGTWRGVCPEFPHGRASVAQQVECARRLWAGGAGRGHWSL